MAVTFDPPSTLPILKPTPLKLPERPTEAAARALPPEPPPPRIKINSEGQPIGGIINTTA
jgi:hypothetical protein